MFSPFQFKIQGSAGSTGRMWLVFLLLPLIANNSFAQPCNCNHIITNEQLAVINGNNINVGPGDTVCIQAGARDYLYLSNFHGDSLHYIVFINCGGPVVIQNNYYMFGIKIANSSYFRFTGSGVDSIKYGIKVLETAVNCTGLYLVEKSTNFEIDHLEIANTGFAGIMSKTDPKCDLSTNRGYFTQCQTIFHDNYIHNTGGEGLYLGHSFYNGYPTTCNGQPDTLFPHDIKGIRVYGNIVENTHWDGIQVGCAIEDCEIYGNTVTGYGTDAIGAQNNGIQIGAGTTGLCYNNFISNGTGTGIIVFGTGNNLIFNNVVLNAGLTYFPSDPTKRVYGIFCDDRATVPGRSFNFVNNTIVNVKTDGIRLAGLLGTNNQIVNNIIIHPGSLGSYSTPAQSYIYIYTGVSATQSNNYTSPSMADIHFRDTLQGNFRLMSNSPARDMGADLSPMGITFDFENQPRPYPTFFDAGAFEYHPENIWTGAKSSSFQDGGNWSKNDVPISDDDIFVPAGTPFKPIVTTSAEVCHNLTLGPDAKITLNPSANLTIHGNLTIQIGAAIDNKGALTIKGNLINQNP